MLDLVDGMVGISLLLTLTLQTEFNININMTDPDMLEVGNGGMTYQEYRAHFTIWALMKVLSFHSRNGFCLLFFLHYM